VLDTSGFFTTVEEKTHKLKPKTTQKESKEFKSLPSYLQDKS
jgi:hypothetical protein